VETATLSQLFDRYGVPYYVKCDLEGGDKIFVEQLLSDVRRPEFVSVEMSASDLPEMLREAGYDRFQIVDQSRLRYNRPPSPSREGRFIDIRFNEKMRGLFSSVGRTSPSRARCFVSLVKL
jgi:hypothetical protein